MSPGTLKSTSIRSARLRALAPRIVVYCVVGIFCIAGLRAAFAPEADSSKPSTRSAAPTADTGAEAFAEAFARVYLTWDAERLETRQELLANYVSDELDEDAGLTPAEASVQDVLWTTVLGSRTNGRRTLVTLAVQTTGQLLYLSVPVSRDQRGFLVVSGYPAFVGPPATAREDDAEPEEEVGDPGLQAVVERAVTNYLAGANGNLLADLTPGAVVSLPPQALEVQETDTATWVQRPSRVAVQVQAEDDSGSAWTLRYELEVEKRDRWYVRSLQVDPTFKGGR